MNCTYLAGPMSGLPDLNFPAFHAEAARLRRLGYGVINPAEINADPSACWAACMRADLIEMLRHCSTIALLPGWHGSRGSTLERKIAEALGMRIVMAADITEPA